MKFEIINVTGRTITLELINDNCVYLDHEIDVVINNEVRETTNKNVITIYGLNPNSEHEIFIQNREDKSTSDVKVFTTKYELATLNVRDFGAKGNGTDDDTLAIQAAIMSCPKDGRVLIPEGKYLIKSLFLKSNITLDIERNAVLLGSTVREDYPILPGITKTTDGLDELYLGSWEGDPMDTFASLITGIDIENVTITGEGIIDGQASFENWWEDAKVKRIAWRPRLIFIRDSRNITLEGITVQNSPSWTIHPLMCENINFLNLKLINPKDSPNTDGINPESCSNVLILGVDFSVGDDCIALKSGKLYLGKKLKASTNNVIIRNCHMKYGHGGIVIGSEMAGGIKNIYAHKCIMEQTDRGIRIKTRRGRGVDGVINGIHAENIQMDKVLTPFVINCFYFCDPDGKTEYVWNKEKLPVDEGTPSIRNIFYKDIICKNTHAAAGYFYGLPEMKIEKINLENIYFDYDENPIADYPAMMSFIDKHKQSGFFIGNAKDVTIKNVTFKDVIGDEFTIVDVEDLKVK